MSASFKNPVSINHRGKVIYFVSQSGNQGEGDALYYNVLNLQISNQNIDNNENWDGYVKLDFPAEVSLAGMNILRVKKPVISTGFFQVVSDQQYIYVLRSTAEALYVNRYLLVEVPNPQLSGITKMEMQPAWEVRFKGSGKPDTPAGEKDTQDYVNQDGKQFIEPVLELPFGYDAQPLDFSEGLFSLDFLPTSEAGVLRWQFLIVDRRSNAILSYSIKRTENGWFDFSENEIDEARKFIQPDACLQLTFNQTALVLAGPPATTVYTKQEPVETSDATVLQLQQAYRLLFVIQVQDQNQNTRIGSLDLAVTRDGTLGYPDNPHKNTPITLALGQVRPAPFSLEFSGIAWAGIQGTPIVLGDTFTQQVWINFTSRETGPNTIIGATDASVEAKNRPPSVWITDKYKVGLGFGDGTTFKQVTTRDNAINSNAWNNLIVLFEKGKYTLLVNGMEYALEGDDFSGSKPAATPVNGIGGSAFGTFKGEMNELRIWSGAQQENAIKYLYKRIPEEEAKKMMQLEAYYPMNEGTGKTLQNFGPDASRSAALSGPTWASASSPLQQDTAATAYIDARGLALYAGIIIPETGRFSEFGNMKKGSRPSLLSSADGYVHLYYQGVNDEFLVAQYDTSNSRAHYGISWEAVAADAKKNQSGTLVFSSRQTGTVFNHSTVEFIKDPVSGLFEIHLDDSQGAAEQWKGLPGNINYLTEVLSGRSLNESADPRLLTGERVYFDYSGQRRQHFQPVGDPLQRGLLQLTSRNADEFVFDTIQVTEDSNGTTCTVRLQVNYSDQPGSGNFSKTFKNVSLDIDEFVRTINGSSAVYDYAKPENTEAGGTIFYNIPAGTQSILVIIAGGDVQGMVMGIKDSAASTPTRPSCDVTIRLNLAGAAVISATWENVSRISGDFIKTISAGGKGPDQQAVAEKLRFYEKTGTLTVQNGAVDQKASLYAMASFLDIFKLNAAGKLSSFSATGQKIQSAESEGEVADLRQGSLLFGVFANGAPDNGFPALVQQSQSATLLQPGRDGGWIAESPRHCVNIHNKRSGFAVAKNNLFNKPLDIAGSLTLEAWVNAQKLTREDIGALSFPVYSRVIHANFADSPLGSQYMLGMTYSTSLQFLTSSDRGPGAIVVPANNLIAEHQIFSRANYAFSFYLKGNLPTAQKGPGSIFVIKPEGGSYPMQRLVVDTEGNLTYELLGNTPLSQKLRTKLQDLEWTQLTLSRKDNTLHFYVNSVPDSSVELPPYPDAAVRNELVLAQNGVSSPFEMELNQVAIWNRTLSDQEVSARDNLALPQDDEGLILLYRLDNVSSGDNHIANEALLTGADYHTTVTGVFYWAYPGVFCSAFAAVRNKVVKTRRSTISTGIWNHLSALYDVHYGIRLSDEAFGDCGNENDLNVTSSISLEAWVRQTQRTAGAAQAVFSKYGQDPANQCYEFGIDGNFKPYLKIRMKGRKTFDPKKPDEPGRDVPQQDLYCRITGNETLLLNEAYYLAATVNITSVVKKFENKNDKDKPYSKTVYTLIGKIYVNGHPAGEFTSEDMYGEIAINQSATNANIGRTKPEAMRTDQQFFNGELSDLRLWNEVLRDEDVMNNYYLLTSDIQGEGLVSAWYFKEQGGRMAYDSKGENNALLSNRDLWILFPASSRLDLAVNGILQTLDHALLVEYDGFQEPQMMFGTMQDTNRAFQNTFIGKLNEIRIWTEVRTLEQIMDNKERFLSGREKQLAGYWRFQEGSGTKVFDYSLHGNDASFTAFDTEDFPVWGDSEAPVSNEAGIVTNTLGGRRTRFSQLATAGPTVTEYADSQFNFRQELFSIYKRCYIYIDLNGIVQRDTNFKIGDLNQVYLGQVQSKPSLIGFIEGAPPLPSENLTMPYYNSPTGYLRYNKLSNVVLTEADDTTISFSSTRKDGSNLALGIGGGFALGSNVAAGVFVIGKVTKAEFTIGAAFNLNWSASETNQSGSSYGISKQSINKFENSGAWEAKNSDWEKATGERRFIPANNGYALVESMTADMYALYLESTGAMVGFTIVPNLDIPPDKNIIYFPINPKYIKNGTLDGKVGLVTDPDHPTADVQRGSYFKPVEAYSLKRTIEKKELDLLSYYDQFNAIDRGKSQESDISAYEQKNPIFNFDDGIPRSDLLNNYVWTAAGGFYAQKESATSIRQETHSGSYSFQWSLGLKSAGKFFGGAGILVGGYYDLSLMGGTEWTITVQKSKQTTQKFSLDVTADPDGFLKKYLGDGNPAMFSDEDVPGKVNTYRFMSFYLSPDRANFNAFFDKSNPIVDPAWFNLSDDPQAAALREAAANPNPAWRILHRVTFVSRIAPEFQPFPLDTNAPPKAKPVNLTANDLVIQLVREELQDIGQPEGALVAEAVRKVIFQVLPGIIPWWAPFLEAAKVDNSYENTVLAGLIFDTINYMLLYFETAGNTTF